jgi:hypothetical protein
MHNCPRLSRRSGVHKRLRLPLNSLLPPGAISRLRSNSGLIGQQAKDSVRSLISQKGPQPGLHRSVLILRVPARRDLGPHILVRRNSAPPDLRGRRTIAPHVRRLVSENAHRTQNDRRRPSDQDRRVQTGQQAASPESNDQMPAVHLKRGPGRSPTLTVRHLNPTDHRVAKPIQQARISSRRDLRSFRLKQLSRSTNQHPAPLRRVLPRAALQLAEPRFVVQLPTAPPPGIPLRVVQARAAPASSGPDQIVRDRTGENWIGQGKTDQGRTGLQQVGRV